MHFIYFYLAYLAKTQFIILVLNWNVCSIVGYLKGKSAIAVARQFGNRKRNFNGERFWARGYAVSTVGLDCKQRINYVKKQKQLDGLARIFHEKKV